MKARGLSTTAADERGMITARRLDLPSAMAGFAAPPCAIQLKFLPLGTRWALLALTPPGMPVLVARWLQPYRPVAINIAPGLSPKILRAHFEELPTPWQQMLNAVTVHYVELTPEGSASIFVQDSKEKIEKFLQSIPENVTHVRERKTQASVERVKLTARQLEVLALAVALGYYETPHKLNLRSLADKLHLSVGAVSELLRRGESLIITNYVDSLSESNWDSNRMPDDPPPAGFEP